MTDTEVLFMNFDGPKGRMVGGPVHARECDSEAAVRWGREEKPPRFFVVRIRDCTLKDLGLQMEKNYREFKPQNALEIAMKVPPEETFWLRHRHKLNMKGLDVDEIADLNDPQYGMIEMNKTRFKSLMLDRSLQASLDYAAGKTIEG